MEPSRPRIFVQIVSYRDEECQWTLKDMFERARHPDRVFAGVCWQYDPEEDKDCFLVKYPRPEQVRAVHYHTQLTKGAGWAREEAQKLWQGEEYILQIQAHMRFEDGWDDALIEMLSRCPSQKAALTTYLPRYDPPRKLPAASRRMLRVRVNKFGPERDPQILHLTGQYLRGRKDPLDGLYRTPFWIGNFLFARAELFKEVPSDPQIFFYGEEIAYSARLWTHGWDLFQPDAPVMYHQWDRRATVFKQEYRKMIDQRNQQSLARIKDLLGLEKSKDREALHNLKKYGLGTARPLEEFWKFAGVDPTKRTISKDAKEGHWHLPESYGPMKGEERGARPRIFVQIASYRDEECQWTVKDLFDKAMFPERIHVGICWQVDEEEDKDCFLIPYPRPKQVKEIRVHHTESLGAGWARQQAQTLWDGEEYTLHIHAHMLFEPGWDETLIDMLARCPSDKPVLTGWLPYYTPPAKKKPLNGMLPRLYVDKLDPDDGQILHLLYRMVPQSGATLAPTPSWVGNFSFSQSETFLDVPFDPYIYFWGEELDFSVRLFTRGYDMFQPDRVVMYHYWDRKNAKDAESYRPLANQRNQRSHARLKHLLGIQYSNNDEVLAELPRYGLGSARSLDEYWRWLGVDLQEKRILSAAAQGNWQMYQPPEEEMLPRIFVQIAAYRDPECEHTVHNLFAQAAHPERITVGICWQAKLKEEPTCFKQHSPQYPGQVRVIRVPMVKSKGANWARHMAFTLWQGEEYVLQIDSHMRFAKGWDDMLVGAVDDCPYEKPVISLVPALYNPPNKLEKLGGKLPLVKVGGVGTGAGEQPVNLTAIKVEQASLTDTYIASPFVLACFYFAPAAAFLEVPTDPHVFFYGDELSLAARLWTHGYNVFQLNELVAYHYWELDYGKREKYKQSEHPENVRSMVRVQHLLGIKRTRKKEALAELERYGLGAARDIESFWNYAGINLVAKKVTQNAKSGEWKTQAKTAKKPAKKPAAKATGKTKAVKPKAASKTAKPKQPTIFVQIAAYRDPECQHTVKDLFDKATHPERISVGICWQFVKGEDDICFEVPYPRPKQVRVIEVDANQSKGVCWARNQVQSLYEDEDYTMQIDSHMRFEPGWDEAYIEMLNQCPQPERTVLTTYPPGYTPPDQCDRGYVLHMTAKEFDNSGIFLMSSRATQNDNLPPKPTLNAFCSACFYFGPGKMIADVRYDPHLYFFGEEITLAVRLWTHGYDLYAPNRTMIFHDWNRGRRSTHFDDHKDWGKLNDLSFARVRHMLGTQKSQDPKVLNELEQYGLGTARTLQQYQQFSGVNFAKRSIAKYAYDGVFDINKQPKPGEGVAGASSKGEGRIFVQIAAYRDRECQWTVKDLFDKAAYPERISVGICWQFDEKADQDCFQIATRPDQVQVFPVDWRDSEGVCWARSITQSMWDGEEYTLQIDSHMRFVEGWDELMIAELAACDSPKPVITCSPASYTPPDNLQPVTRATIRRASYFDQFGSLRFKGESLQVEPDKPLRGAFIAAGYMFARSEIIAEVPYDPFLYFDQEEVSLAARLFTHGWDVFSARKQFIYHYYNDSRGSVRPMHWRDIHAYKPEMIQFLRKRGQERFDHLFGFKPSTEQIVTHDMDKYGFGLERSLDEYEAFCGIDFRNKKVSERALKCQFIEGLEQWRKVPIEIPVQERANANMDSMPAAEQTVVDTALPRTGDCIPHFELLDHEGKGRGLELYAGIPSMLFFLPANNEEYVARFFEHLNKHQKGLAPEKIWQIFVLDGLPDQLAQLRDKFGIHFPLWSDANRTLMRSLGVVPQEEGASARPVGMLLNSNLRVVKVLADLNPTSMVSLMVGEAKTLLEAAKPKPALIRRQAPALIVPDALSPELVKRCIKAFNDGPTFDGTVGGDSRKGYRPHSKIRKDYIPTGSLVEELDDHMSRTVFPEISKVFGTDISFREGYKIGCYYGNDGGFFTPHRDNYDKPLGYRRIAMTIQLNDNYEGGGLRFPEYSGDVYRPEVGSAILFPCTMMHEALKITKGQRYVVVGFFHNSADESFRRQYFMKDQRPLNNANYTPTIKRDFPGVAQSRDFYRRFINQHTPFKNGEIVTPEGEVVGTGNTGSTLITPPSGILPVDKPQILILHDTKHQPKKVFESKEGIVLDDFLPPGILERVYDHVIRSEYEHINTKGKTVRAWHIHDGFPLRSNWNMFYQSDPEKKAEGINYPSNTPIDRFMEYVMKTLPYIEHMIGKPKDNWDHFSVTSWIYQQGTALSLHDDGAGVYTGAYAFFLNPVWKLHWGGLLLMVNEAGNNAISEYKKGKDGYAFHMRKYFHLNQQDELAMNNGFAQMIFPKYNRIVFIAPDAYHMVTTVLPTAGDRVRTSLAGFFTNTKKNDGKNKGNYD